MLDPSPRFPLFFKAPLRALQAEFCTWSKLTLQDMGAHTRLMMRGYLRGRIRIARAIDTRGKGAYSHLTPLETLEAGGGSNHV